jgi:adenosylcobyric acid synthase
VARSHARRPLYGICGGFQMLGERILDPEGVESSQPEVNGLGLLPITTRFARQKVTVPVRIRLAEGLPLLDAAGGAEVSGYQIHCGRVERTGGQPFGTLIRSGDSCELMSEGSLINSQALAGTLVHGLFEDARVRAALRHGLGIGSAHEERSDPYDTLADHFGRALDLDLLDRLAGL